MLPLAVLPYAAISCRHTCAAAKIAAIDERHLYASRHYYATLRFHLRIAFITPLPLRVARYTMAITR